MAIIYETAGQLEIHFSNLEAKKVAGLATVIALFDLLRRMYEESPDRILYILTIGCNLKLDALSGLQWVNIPYEVRRAMQ